MENASLEKNELQPDTVRVLEAPDLSRPGKQHSRLFKTRVEALQFIDESSKRMQDDKNPVSFFQIVDIPLPKPTKNQE